MEASPEPTEICRARGGDQPLRGMVWRVFEQPGTREPGARPRVGGSGWAGGIPLDRPVGTRVMPWGLHISISFRRRVLQQ